MIAVVDDDASVREATKGLLRSIGYEACTFASAEEFLDSNKSRDSACIITDVHMPGIDGLELQARLAEEGSHLPIIFITAFPAEDLRNRALRSGAFGFLDKPFDDDELIRCLETALGRNSVN